jgi:gamma-D-glutamyl-L-lysine dipeptidyl-peptidase
MKARININVADIRKEASQIVERTNQVLYNEVVEIVESGNAMSRVKSLDNYEGWVGNQFLSPHETFFGDGPFMVAVSLANGYEAPDRLSRRSATIPYGCRLYGKKDYGWLEIQCVRYGRFHISESDLAGIENQKFPHEKTVEILTREVERFLGVPYLWGGRSYFGMDCSGLAGLIAARYGVILPRDTKDQISAGVHIERNDIRTGDLIFFPGHVALAIDNTLYIHSSRINGGVAYNSLDPSSPLYNHSHDKSFLEARRIFE